MPPRGLDQASAKERPSASFLIRSSWALCGSPSGWRLLETAVALHVQRAQVCRRNRPPSKRSSWARKPGSYQPGHGLDGGGGGGGAGRGCGHPVGTAEERSPFAIVAKNQNRREVRQGSADDALQPGWFVADTGPPWPQATHATESEFDLDARLGGFVEQGNDPRITKRHSFLPDRAHPGRRGEWPISPLDQGLHPLAQVTGATKKPPKLWLFGEACEVIGSSNQSWPSS